MWLRFLEGFNGISLISPMHDVSYSHWAFATDASDWGFAAVFHAEWFQAQWPEHWSMPHIDIHEFLLILLALCVWGDTWRHVVLTFFCKIRQWSRSRFPRDPGMLSILRGVMQLSLCHDFIIQANHLPGKINVAPDTLSRSQPDPACLQQHGLRPFPTASPVDLRSLITHYGL